MNSNYDDDDNDDNNNNNNNNMFVYCLYKLVLCRQIKKNKLT